MTPENREYVSSVLAAKSKLKAGDWSDQNVWNTWVESTAVVCAGGKAGERRANRGSDDGWTLALDHQGLIPYHEASHLLLAIVFGDFPYQVTIEPRPDVRIAGEPGYHVGGYAHYGHAPLPKEPAFRPGHEAEDDETQIAREVAVLADGDESRVPMIRQRIEQRAAALLDDVWPWVMVVAEALIHHRTLGQDEIREILAPRRGQWDAQESESLKCGVT